MTRSIKCDEAYRVTRSDEVYRLIRWPGLCLWVLVLSGPIRAEATKQRVGLCVGSVVVISDLGSQFDLSLA